MKNFMKSKITVIKVFLFLISAFALSWAKTSALDDILSKGSRVSVMFVFDNSTSMFLYLANNPHPNPNDSDGVRYTVARELLDSIYARSPSSEVGIAAYATHLYFDPQDDPLFTAIDSTGYNLLGGYIPLLQLDKATTVGNNTGKTGYDVLKQYLTLKDYTFVYQNHENIYKNPAYVPTGTQLNPLTVEPSGTNVWGGFAAVKQAMKSSINEREYQYAVFFSDGEQGHVGDAGPVGFDWDDLASVNAPTTFAAYLDTTGILFQIENFIELIKENGYSINNPNSLLMAFHPLQTVQKELYKNKVIKLLFNDMPQVALIPCQSPTYNRRPTLTWHTAGVSTYTIQIAPSPDMSQLIVSVPVTDTLYTSQVDLPIDTLYWRVKGDNMAWSDIGSFEIIPQTSINTINTGNHANLVNRKTQIEIYTLDGRCIGSYDQLKTGLINRKISSGIYIVKVKTGGKISLFKKMINR